MQERLPGPAQPKPPRVQRLCVQGEVSGKSHGTSYIFATLAFRYQDRWWGNNEEAASREAALLRVEMIKSSQVDEAVRILYGEAVRILDGEPSAPFAQLAPGLARNALTVKAGRRFFFFTHADFPSTGWIMITQPRGAFDSS